jgi:hypothetical protein
MENRDVRVVEDTVDALVDRHCGLFRIIKDGGLVICRRAAGHPGRCRGLLGDGVSVAEWARGRGVLGDYIWVTTGSRSVFLPASSYRDRMAPLYEARVTYFSDLHHIVDAMNFYD